MALSLKYRIAAVIFVLEAMMMGVVLWQTLGHSLEASHAQFAANESTMLGLISGMGRVSLLTEEYADLQPYLEELLQEPRVVRAMLADATGRVVVSTHAADVGVAIADSLGERQGEDVYWRRQMLGNSAGVLGELAIGFSNQALLDAYDQSRDLGVAIAVVGMVIIAVVGVLMGALLTRRLERVTAAAQRFARGERDVRTGVDGRDELGELARAFDHMARTVDENQQQLLRHRGRLEEVVSERTRELEDAHAELVRQARLATLGRLTATVAHELRNPLGVIRATAQFIAHDRSADGVRRDRARERLDRNIVRCDRIIGELLDFTRQPRVDRRAVPLDAWLASVLDEHSFPEGIRVERDLGLGPIEVAVDEELLRRAVCNVIDNACHAVLGDGQPERVTGERRVSVTTRYSAERFEIVVSDSGIGMPSDVLPHIFEPLYSTRAFGVGLGLSVVEQVMNQHEGGIEVTSEEDHGTTVILWLPECVAGTAADESAA